MRVLKKPKKNPTFNEYFPQQIYIDIGTPRLMFESVFSAENVEKFDTLLSLAVTGGDYEWL